MPVRSLTTSVLAWPKKSEIESALGPWARGASRAVSGVLGIGYFGSYARGDWGVGSDLDLVIVLEESELPFERRPSLFDTTTLPVPADTLVYTSTELASRLARPGRFVDTLRRETTWVWRRTDFPGLPG